MVRYSYCVGLAGETRQSTLCAISRSRTNSACTLPFLDFGGIVDVSGCFPMLCSLLSGITRRSSLPLEPLERDYARLFVVAPTHASCARDTTAAVASSGRGPATRPPTVDLRPS